MITHIVMIKLKDDAPEGTAERIRDKLLALADATDLMRKWEVGTNIGASSSPGDVVVYSTFDSLEDITAFRTHPAHVEAVKNDVKPYLQVSYSLDYESE